MTANELDREVAERVKRFEFWPLSDALSMVEPAHILEIKDETGRANRYYQWLAGLMQVVEPAQVVELGAAAGMSTVMLLEHMPKNSILFSVDIDPLAWRWVKKDYSNLVKVTGDDTDMNIWPEGTPLGNTDVWWIDSLHTEDHLRKELQLYSPYFKKGAIVVLDDINLEDMRKVWDELPYDKLETTHPNHYDGFGHFIV
jgi:cephalosporin hydroxylase